MSRRVDGFRLPPLYTFFDIAFVVLVGLLSMAFYGQGAILGGDSGPRVAIVQFEDRELARLSLEADTTVTVRGVLGEVTVVVAGGAMKFEDANCPARICEKTGWVSRTGGAIVCAPNHLMAKIERADGAVDDSGGLDALSR